MCWIKGFRLDAFTEAMRRQRQLLGDGNAGARQFFDNGVADKLGAVPVARLRKPRVQFAQELFIHGDGQQLLTGGTLIWHGPSIHRSYRGKNQNFC